MAKRSQLSPWAVAGPALALGAAWAAWRYWYWRPAERDKSGATGDLLIRLGITIQSDPERLYRLWRDPETHASFLRHVHVTPLGDKRWHWRHESPSGHRVEWETEFTHEKPGELLRWRSMPGQQSWLGARARSFHARSFSHGSGHQGSGLMRFKPAGGDRGAVVELLVDMNAVFTQLMRRRIQRGMEEMLRRFKQFAETGEIPTTLGQPSGRRSFLTAKIQPFDRKQSEPQFLRMAR